MFTGERIIESEQNRRLEADGWNAEFFPHKLSIAELPNSYRIPAGYRAIQIFLLKERFSD